MIKALSGLEAAIYEHGLAESQAETLDVTHELKGELAKDKPNRIRVISILTGIAACVSGIADVKQAYLNVKTVASAMMGIDLP